MKKIITAAFIIACVSINIFFPVISCSAVAGVVTAGEAMQALEIFDFLADSGLVEVDQLGTYFTPSLFLRAVSGTIDYFNLPIEAAPEWVSKIFDVNNQLFWNNDHSGVVQQQNGQIVSIDNPSDIWYVSDHMNDSPYIPINFSRQANGHTFEYESFVPELIDVIRSNNPCFDSIYMLPILNYGGSSYYCSQITLFSFVGSNLYYGLYSSKDISSVTKQPSLLRTISNSNPVSLRCGFSSDSFTRFYYSYTTGTDPSDWDRRSISFHSLSNSFSWLSASDGSSSTVSLGDMSYLIYEQQPIFVPTDMPDGNFVMNPNPDYIGETVIISPSNEYGNLFDFLQNGFQFTGKFEATIDTTIKFSGSVSADITADINTNHSGDVNINITYPENNIWSEQGKASDFGHGVSLDGNAFNDGLSWLINTARAVPDSLSLFFPYIPSAVWYICSCAVVVMVFLGLWRTFHS